MNRLLFLAVGMFSMGCDNYIVVSLLSEISGFFSASLAATSQSVSVFRLAYGISAPLFAIMLARKPARVTLAAALGVFFAGNLLSILAPSLALHLVGRVVSGIGAGIFTPLAASTAAQLVPNESRGRALGILWGSNVSGTVLGGPVGLYLAALGGWQAGFFLILALALVALLGIATLLPPLEVSAPPSLRERILALSDRSVLAVIGVTFVTAAGSLGLFTFASPLMEGAAGTVAQALWVWGIGGIVGGYSIGYVVDSTRKPRLVMAFVMATLITTIITIPSLSSIPYICLLPFFVWGLAGWATVTPQQHTLFGLQREHQTVLAALNGSALAIGGALGSSLAALLLSQGFDVHHLPYAAGLLIFLALLGQATLIARHP
jgi:predicted MFS family arabinose efflux permease